MEFDTGDSESLGLGWDDSLALVQSDPDELVPVWLLRDWESRNRALLPTEHLAPKQPFILGGEYTVANLAAADLSPTCGGMLSWLGSFALYRTVRRYASPSDGRTRVNRAYLAVLKAVSAWLVQQGKGQER